jgi:putative oxidoreductase
MHLDILTKFGHYKDYAPFVLRVGLGILMLTHGAGKLLGADSVIGQFLLQLGIPAGAMPGMTGFIAFVTGLGIPFPYFFGYSVALLEAIGGALLLLGLLTRLSALLLSVQFTVIVFYVRMIKGVGWENDLALLAGFLALLILGPGAYSLERLVFKNVRF